MGWTGRGEKREDSGAFLRSADHAGEETAAAVYLSKEMYPSLFEDVDADEALRLLTEEAGGTPLSGIFAYAG